MTATENDRPETLDCGRAREVISAAVDGAAGPEERAAALAHRSRCLACDRFADWAGALNVALRAQAAERFDSGVLWARISAGLPRASLWRRRRTAIAAAALLALVIGGALVGQALRPSQPLVVAEAVNDFLTFRASGRTLDVSGPAPREVRDWLTARITFELPAGLRPPAGFRLLGGRLCSFLERRLASLHYARGTRIASLYVMEDDALALSRRGYRTIEGQRVLVAAHKGVTNLVWHSDGLVYVVVSDLGETAALEFAAAVLQPRSDRLTREAAGRNNLKRERS